MISPRVDNMALAEPGRPVRAWWRDSLSSVIVPMLLIVLCIGLWEVVVRVFHVAGYILPPPEKVAEQLWVSRSILASDTLVTLQEIVVGFGLALLISVPISILTVSVPLLEKAFYPLLIVSQTIPKIAVAPLFVVWFGFGSTPKYLTTFLICFFPVAIDTIVGLRSVSPESIELMRSMGASRRRTITELRLPAALPYAFSGIKVAITLAVVGAIVAEFVGSTSGLGYELLKANSNLNTALLFAALVVLTVIGLALFYLTELIERFLIPWHITRRSTAVSTTA